MWAAAIGGHLLKSAANKAINYAKNNPEAIGRGIGKLAKWGSKAHPKFGGYIRKAASLASTLAPNNAYINKMSNAIKSTSKSSSTPSSLNTSSYRKNEGGYIGAL